MLKADARLFRFGCGGGTLGKGEKGKRMTRVWLRIAVVGATLGAGLLPLSARADTTKCTMTFSLEGWSIFYESASGTGTIRCDNGQTAPVTIRAKGGGLTAGKSKIDNGRGTFSEVSDISDLFGTYAAAQAHAGAGDSSEARVVTKGDVSLALSGTGKGIDVGFSFGKFEIEEAGTAPEP